MLRISVVHVGAGRVVLGLEGRLAGAWVGELRRACERALAESKRLTLDLGSVSFVDREGIALLRDLVDRRTAVERCSPFVAELLRRAEPCVKEES